MSEQKVKLFVAAKAVIGKDDKVLVIRESGKYADGTQTGKYGFPGGRLDPNESVPEGLTREIKEETGLEVKIIKPLWVSEWRPHVRDENWHVIAIFFECKTNSDKVTLSQDHDDYKWIDPKEYKNHNLIETEHCVIEALFKTSA